MRNIIFYKTESGECPIERFLDALPARQARQITWVLQIIEQLEIVPTQYFKKLPGRDDIWEISIDFGGKVFRFFGLLENSNLIILTEEFA